MKLMSWNRIWDASERDEFASLLRAITRSDRMRTLTPEERELIRTTFGWNTAFLDRLRAYTSLVIKNKLKCRLIFESQGNEWYHATVITYPDKPVYTNYKGALCK